MNVESVRENMWVTLPSANAFLVSITLKSIFQIHANQVILTPHHVALLHHFVIHNVTGVIKMKIFKVHLSRTITRRLYPLYLHTGQFL